VVSARVVLGFALTRKPVNTRCVIVRGLLQKEWCLLTQE